MLIGLALGLACAPELAIAAERPEWRGPTSDGTVAEPSRPGGEAQAHLRVLRRAGSDDGPPSTAAIGTSERLEIPSPASSSLAVQPFFFALSVADVDASSAWYRKVFGFEVVRETDLVERGLRIRLLRRPGGFLELIENSAARPLGEAAPDVSRRHLVHGVFKVGFVCDDLEEMQERLAQLGISLRGRVITESDGSFRSLQIEDPDGIVLQVFEALDPR